MASRRRNPNRVPVPQAPTTQTCYLAGDAGTSVSSCGLPVSSGYYAAAEPAVVFSSPVSFDDAAAAAYPRLTRRYSDWSDASVGPLALGAGAGAKFPEIEITDFSYAAADAAYMPSTASSVTCASSTVSRASSIGSEYSPVLTESTSESWHSHRPLRGPSPLRNVCQRPGGEEAAAKEEDGIDPQKSGHPHICLWGRDGDCEKGGVGGFATREELNRHVKVEHLLECPVPGCAETAFETRDFLSCHMKWDHGSNSPTSENNTTATSACRTANLLRANLAPPRAHTQDDSLPVAGASVAAVADRTSTAQDRILKMEMSIGISKRKCREQLRTVLEKKLRRLNGPPKSAESPGMARSRTPKLLESASFPVIWEHGILPFLIEFMPKWCGPGHVVSVTRGRRPNTRRVCIMTRRAVTMARRMVIAVHVRDLLPEIHRSTTTFVFSTGKVDRMVWSRGLGKEMPDEVCEPRNPFAYISPCMGDSIGASLSDGDEATATLGPCVTAEGGSYWLACFHPFIGASQRTSPALIEHPSPQDRAQCVQKQHDVLDNVNHRVGNLTATSGFDLKTTRITHDPYWDDVDKEPPLVVTDWILISSSTRQANLLRRFPTAAQRRETPVTSTSAVSPGANVVSTGRTSGFQRGQVCEIPAYVDGADNGTEKGTREWFVEEPFPYENENEWIRGGIGVEGDSGAAIVDSDTNALVGQLWGRNRYWGPGPRMTFFTPISDIFDDIQEKCGMAVRPQLPQYRDEGDRWPAYPVCKKCYDLREYLDSRRSSRESLMSMIGAHDARGEHDNDLTSVSELATPKDHSYLVRHVGLDETASSFGGGSAVSPAPVHAFYAFPQAASPGVSDLRSPYPQALHEDDLYEPRCPQASDVAFGKRPAIIPPEEQGATQHSNKRRRTTTYGSHA